MWNLHGQGKSSLKQTKRSNSMFFLKYLILISHIQVRYIIHGSTLKHTTQKVVPPKFLVYDSSLSDSKFTQILKNGSQICSNKPGNTHTEASSIHQHSLKKKKSDTIEAWRFDCIFIIFN